jgi:hypothetical protein
VGFLTAALIVVLVIGVALGAYAMFAPKRERVARVAREGPPLQATTDWTNEAGDEFAGLSESARCDLVFAVAALEDSRSQRLLEHALDDPAEPVALAAAHALVSSGRRAVVERYLADHPGLRADRIAQTLALLDSR